MKTECNGKIIDCKLVRLIYDGKISDNRNIALCERNKQNCDKCAWNTDFEKTVKYRFREMNRAELTRLKKEYGITAKSLKCLERC